jgi:hypothetical protein
MVSCSWSHRHWSLRVRIQFSRNPAGIVFGLLLIGLGIATWRLTSFGGVPWEALDQHARLVAGTGSIIGNGFLLLFIGLAPIISWAIAMFADSEKH